MSARYIVSCDGCGARKETPVQGDVGRLRDPLTTPVMAMWAHLTFSANGETYDVCSKCVDKAMAAVGIVRDIPVGPFDEVLLGRQVARVLTSVPNEPPDRPPNPDSKDT